VRGLRTKEALVRAAAEVFVHDGFFDARIVDITARAGVAVGTFYTYLDSKEAIFRAVVDERIDELYRASEVHDVSSDDPRPVSRRPIDASSPHSRSRAALRCRR